MWSPQLMLCAAVIRGLLPHPERLAARFLTCCCLLSWLIGKGTKDDHQASDVDQAGFPSCSLPMQVS